MGVSLKMTVRAVVMVCCSLISALCAQDYDDRIPTLEEFAANFECPEKNGLFPDPDQCDLYYECIASVPEAIFCAPGLIFDFSHVNNEKCKLPSEAESCGSRQFLQTPMPGDKNCPTLTASLTTTTPTCATSSI